MRINLRKDAWAWAKALMLVSTGVFTFTFVATALLFDIYLGVNGFFRAFWGFMILGLVVFLRATWPPRLWRGWAIWAKTFLIVATGVIFVLTGIVGVALSPAPDPWILALGLWLFLQCLGMTIWALLHFKRWG